MKRSVYEKPPSRPDTARRAEIPSMVPGFCTGPWVSLYSRGPQRTRRACGPESSGVGVSNEWEWLVGPGRWPRGRSRPLSAVARFSVSVLSVALLAAPFGTPVHFPDRPSSHAEAVVDSVARSARAWNPTPQSASAPSPRNPVDPDRRAVELGVRLEPLVDGWVTAVKFYRKCGSDAPVRVRLWTNEGRLLSDATGSVGRQSGWRTVRLARPIPIFVGHTYVASYSALDGGYPDDTFSLSPESPIVRNGLKAIQGVYSYSLDFPTEVWRDSNYYVDVEFARSAPTTTTRSAPTTTTRSAPTTFPDATTTGARGTLKQIRGPVTLSQPGMILKNVEVLGQITVKADGVTIQNVKVESDDYWVVLNYGRGTIINDSTLIGTSATQASIGDANAGYFDGDALDISGAGDGVKMGANSRLEDSYIHDLASGSDIHNDGIEVTNSPNVVIRHNTILNAHGQTSAIMLSEFGSNPSTNVLIEQNLLAGGGYTIYGGAPDTAMGYIVRDNVFSTRYYLKSGYFGPVAYWSGRGNEWVNNTWADGPSTGQAVRPG